MNEESLTGVDGAIVRWVQHLPLELEGGIRVGAFTTAMPGAILRVVPGFARFLARDGWIVEVAPEHADRSRIRPLIQGPIAAALIHQRGNLPLHGATLAHPCFDIAMSIVGTQGAGKSTLAFELVRRGWRLLSDDLTRLTVTNTEVWAWPGRAGIKLCGDACDSFGLSRHQLMPIGERGKWLMQVAQPKTPFPLRRIFALERGGEVDSSSMTRGAALALLSSNTMKLAYVAPLGVVEAHLSSVSRIAANTVISRLRGFGSPSALADRIEAAAWDRAALT